MGVKISAVAEPDIARLAEFAQQTSSDDSNSLQFEKMEGLYRESKSSKIGQLLRQLTSMSSKTKLRLKILFSVLLFASLFVCGKVDLSKSWQIATHANGWYLALTMFLLTSATTLNGYRWQKLAAAVGLHKPLMQLVQFCFVGNFFNLFLPSTVGGDVGRCYYLSKGTGKYKDAFYSVLADRTFGIAVLFVFAALGILLGPGGSGMSWQLKLPILGGAFGIVFVMPFMPWIARKTLGESNWITRQLCTSSANVYWRDKPLIMWAVLTSVVLQIMFVVCHIAVGLSLGLNQIPVWYYFVFYPSVTVLGFITPSFNGIGIREWAYTYFLTLAGIDRDHAVTYAIMWLGLNTFWSLTGGLVYVLGHFKYKDVEAEIHQHEIAPSEPSEKTEDSEISSVSTNSRT